MATNRKASGRASSMPAGVGIGAAWALGWTLISSAALAKLIDMEHLPEHSVGYGALVILLVGGFLSASAAFGSVKGKRLQVSLIAGAAYYLSLLAMTAMFFGGQYTGMGVTALVIFAGCGVSILLGIRPNHSKKGRKYPKVRV